MDDIDHFKGLPKILKVGAYRFRISVVDTDHPKLEDNEGMTVFSEFRIYINKGISFQRLAEVVQHEISHCINWVYGIDDSSTEEQFVGQHSKGVIDLWINNPRYMTWVNKLIRRMRKEANID